jgi:hypothetical protein
MDIKYPSRSKFLKACEEAIRKNKKALLSGIPISVRFSPQGYNGEIQVKIEKTNSTTFWADWESADPTRFPARIKAAACALFREECYGVFTITHKSGILTIRYLSKESESKKFKFEWEGGLSEIRKKFTSVELQHKALEWR